MRSRDEIERSEKRTNIDMGLKSDGRRSWIREFGAICASQVDDQSRFRAPYLCFTLAGLVSLMTSPTRGGREARKQTDESMFEGDGGMWEVDGALVFPSNCVSALKERY